jgi:ribonuclease BN (tRNA processing enzyme)
MKLTFLGTGGAFSDFRVNYHTNLLVEVGERQFVLIDCGGTAVQSMKELDIKPWEIVGVFITHMHGDHMGGLEQLLWERCYTGPTGAPGWLKTPVYAANPVHRSLRIALTECVDEITTPNGTEPGGYDKLVEVHYLERDVGVAIGGAGFNTYPTAHVCGPAVDKPCYGVEIIDMPRGRRAYHTSDTVFNASLFAPGARYPGDAAIVFHDCSFGPKYPGTVHTHYEELLTLPDEVRARIVLMHHTQVPNGIDVKADGFLDAADRHQTFDL